MTAPPLKRPVANCQNKRRHPDELTARAAAMVALQRHARELEKLYIYHCPHCRGWHLTNNSNGRRYKVTKDQPVYDWKPIEECV